MERQWYSYICLFLMPRVHHREQIELAIGNKRLMDLFEIHLMHHSWNGCNDPRPWLIVDFPESGNVIGCFPISTECYCGNCFFISESHPNFSATGLDHASNVTDMYIIELPGNSVIKRIGELEGELLAEFRQYSGL